MVRWCTNGDVRNNPAVGCVTKRCLVPMTMMTEYPCSTMRSAVMVLGAAILACGGSSPGAGDWGGCYVLKWDSIERPRMVPPWLIPEAVALTGTRNPGGNGWLVEWGFGPDTTHYGDGDERPWFHILVKRHWEQIENGDVRIVLTDGLFSRWTIDLHQPGDTGGVEGTAEFGTTLGGGAERVHRAWLHASTCEAGRPGP